MIGDMNNRLVLNLPADIEGENKKGANISLYIQYSLDMLPHTLKYVPVYTVNNTFF